MRAFGTDKYGNEEGFKIICNLCGREARLVPIHHYENGDYQNVKKITLEIRCICENKCGATIHS